MHLALRRRSGRPRRGPSPPEGPGDVFDLQEHGLGLLRCSIGRGPRLSSAAPLEDRDQAVGEKQDHQQQDQAVDRHADRAGGDADAAQDLRQRGEQHGAQHRTVPDADAADDIVDQQIDGHRKAEFARGDDVGEMGVEPAGKARQRRPRGQRRGSCNRWC